ncbi:MAG TPA: sugar phosphate isomerase/epimerase family protein [Kiritimatiellia bacterium]|jgi:sugar phosphate isomerase/epimerase|nr:MAG: Xylose isomerase-like TIM barrel [Verrucomicrobia bacterium ADurb.Bin070]HPB11865.1 sugar phosphate isomerase/epimerase family protein [Kiritimatiellia bacterium]HPO37156.1 sugar phosphate isomerase/epimerase family protein [Kiritimatiellia bacterium]HQQ92718.1 sugar phosphate isomerase/epimerase family protein [Kiritimatiellia bacterium]
MKKALSRRHVLTTMAQTTALSALGAALPQTARAAAQTAPNGLTIGISTLGFGGHTNAALAAELAAAGFSTIQFFLTQTDSAYWKYNSRADLSSLTPAHCKAIAATYRDAGLAIHSIGVYTNLMHPDDAELNANLAYFEAMMEIGGHMGVRTFITEAGHHYDTAVPAPRVPLEFQDAVWPRMIATARRLDDLAAKHDAKVLFEPYFQSFFASAKRVRLFVEELNSPRLRVLLDPANLLELNDLDEMFTQLAPWIDCLHAKDRKHHTSRGVAAGKGDIDYKRFVTLAAKTTPQAPLILEYVGPKDYQDARAHLLSAMQACAIPEAKSTLH